MQPDISKSSSSTISISSSTYTLNTSSYLWHNAAMSNYMISYLENEACKQTENEHSMFIWNSGAVEMKKHGSCKENYINETTQISSFSSSFYPRKNDFVFLIAADVFNLYFSTFHHQRYTFEVVFSNKHSIHKYFDMFFDLSLAFERRQSLCFNNVYTNRMGYIKDSKSCLYASNGGCSMVRFNYTWPTARFVCVITRITYSVSYYAS